MTKKISIFIIVAVLILAGIVGYIATRKFSPQGRCGDNICDRNERANPDLCPSDCVKPLGQKFCGRDSQGYCLNVGEGCENGYEIIGVDKCGQAAVCCAPIKKKDEHKTCSDLNGDICLSIEVCPSPWVDASDTDRCCPRECEAATTIQSNARDSFFEIHLEPNNANGDAFNALAEFVDIADSYGAKLTLLFTPQWAEMILSDNAKYSLIEQWEEAGHEIGGHHHGPSVCPWDGYTNLDVNGEEFRNRQNLVPCPESARAVEKYLGDMDAYMELIGGVGEIQTITMSDADVDWPNGIKYSAGGRKLREAISKPQTAIFNGQQVVKLSSATFLAKTTVLGDIITLADLKEKYLSEQEGVFGINGKINNADNINLYKQWFEFLSKQDPDMKHSKTVALFNI